MRRFLPAVSLSITCLALVTAACGGSKKSAADSAATTSVDSATASKYTVTATGVGPVLIGTTIFEATAALGQSLAATEPTGSCLYATIPDGPKGLSMMVVDGRVVRVDVKTRGIRTAEGAQVGDDEARIQSLYPGQVEVMPHKYTDGHYLVVTPKSPDASENRIIFETDGKVVTMYRAGKRPQVEWVEGCA